MKSKEIPPAALYSGIGVILLVLVIVAYMMFKPAPTIDTSKLTPQQMSDPDPPRSRGAANPSP